ncbi:MAG: hypothetical protein IPG57_18975 [Burkholderiales bacterium]|nr:hypothetical protein [Burkholderiales bacterium]
MLMHAPVMALLLVALLGAAALTAASVFAVGLLRDWDVNQGSRRQIELERRSELVATVLAQVLWLQGAAVLLMVYNADRIAPLLVGAMCAFGSFNASAWGFPALYAKLALFFGAVTWLALHRADVLGRDQPLTRRKYRLLLALLPLALADAALTLAYFTDLQPDTLTSCCGSAFHPEREGIAAHASALAPDAALWLLAAALPLLLAWGWAAGRFPKLAVGYGAASLGFLVVGLVAVVAAVSPYVYESPHHHCPFCLLKREYGYIGFALYLPLFGGAAAGLASGALSLRPPASLQALLPARTRRLRWMSMAGFVTFALLAAVLVGRSGLRM